MATFPRATRESCEENDSIMERVPLPTMGIGARTSGLPKGDAAKRDSMNIEHVGNQNKK